MKSIGLFAKKTNLQQNWKWKNTAKAKHPVNQINRYLMDSEELSTYE